MALASFLKKQKTRKARVKKAAAATEPAAKVARGSESLAHRVGLHMIITEKAVRQQIYQRVTFRVAATATKGQITQAIEEVYNVRPVAVRTVRMRPKLRRRGKVIGWTPIWKKAYVTVADISKFNAAP